MKPTAFLRSFSIVACALLISRALAADGNWAVAGGGNWSLATNWSSNPTVPGTVAGDIIGLNNDITANSNVTINTTSRTVGTLNIGDSNNTHSFTLNANGGGTLTFNNSGAGASINETGALVDTISAAIILNDNLAVSTAGSLTLGAISETGGARTITKTGAGTLTLNGAGTYSGGFNLNAGQVNIGSDSAFGSGKLTVATGTTLNFTVSAALNNAIDLAGTVNLGRGITGVKNWTQGSAGAVTLTADTTLNSLNNGINWVVNSAIGETGGARSLSFTGNTLNVTLNGDNTYTGATVVTSSDLTIGGTGRLGSGNYAGNITLTGAGNDFIYSSSADQLLSGNITGLGTLTKNTSASSTLTLSGANTASGITTIAAGTVQFAKQTALYNNVTTNWTAARINVKNSGTLAFNVGGSGEFTTGNVTTLLTNLANSTSATNGMNAGSNFGFDTTNASGGIFTIGDVIADSGGASGGARGVTKLGTGTLTLTNANTYTGATTVSAGVLAVNGSLANTTTTVNGGGTLQGSGGITGSVTIQNGGTLATGNNNIESLATGALELQASSTFAYQLDKDAVASVAGDLTAVTGNLTLDLANAAILTLIDRGAGSWTAGEELTLISYTGIWNTGLFTYLGDTLADDSTFTFSGIDWLINYNDTVAGTNYTDDLTGSSFVTMTAVPLSNIPEPSAALLGGLGMLMLLRRKRHAHLSEVTGLLPKKPGTPSGGRPQSIQISLP